jgi:hypothetical protein
MALIAEQDAVTHVEAQFGKVLPRIDVVSVHRAFRGAAILARVVVPITNRPAPMLVRAGLFSVLMPLFGVLALPRRTILASHCLAVAGRRTVDRTALLDSGWHSGERFPAVGASTGFFARVRRVIARCGAVMEIRACNQATFAEKRFSAVIAHAGHARILRRWLSFETAEVAGVAAKPSAPPLYILLRRKEVLTTLFARSGDDTLLRHRKLTLSGVRPKGVSAPAGHSFVLPHSLSHGRTHNNVA